MKKKSCFFLLTVAAAFFFSAAFSQTAKKIEPLLISSRLLLEALPGSDSLSIEAANGQMTIADAGHLFKVCVYYADGYGSWDINRPSFYRSAKKIGVYDLSDSDLKRLVVSDPESFWLNQGQIIKFCYQFPLWLKKDEPWPLFLTKSESEYVFVEVRQIAGGLEAHFYPLNSWPLTGGRHYLIIPRTF